jgi:hypothetical protein
VHEGVTRSKNFGDELAEKDMARWKSILTDYKRARLLDHETQRTIKELK